MNYFIEPHHTKKEVVFLQFRGLGDILFIEPLYRHYHNKGYKVIAPVDDELIWIQEYIPYVEFHKKSQFRYSYETVQQANDGRLHLPTRFSHPLLRGHDLHFGDERHFWMPDKYEYLGLPVDLWRTLSFKRNEERENKLQKKVSVFGYEKYNFVNNMFGGNFAEVNFKVNNDLPVIYMQKIEGFTMLDWGNVIENAENVYTVETSIIYYIESLKTKAKEKHLYPRLPWLGNCEYMRLTLGDSWEYHTEENM